MVVVIVKLLVGELVGLLKLTTQGRPRPRKSRKELKEKKMEVERMISHRSTLRVMSMAPFIHQHVQLVQRAT